MTNLDETKVKEMFKRILDYAYEMSQPNAFARGINGRAKKYISETSLLKDEPDEQS